MMKTALCKSAEKLDFELWLSQPVFSYCEPKKLKTYYTQSVLYARRLASKYPLSEKNVFSSIFDLGVTDITPYTETEKCLRTDKAYYEIDNASIHWNDDFPLKIKSNIRNGVLDGAKRIQAALLFHEAFHHIEEYKEKPTDVYLQQMFGLRFFSLFRELAAFAFVNAQMKNYCCQWIDFYWREQKNEAAR